MNHAAHDHATESLRLASRHIGRPCTVDEYRRWRQAFLAARATTTAAGVILKRYGCWRHAMTATPDEMS